MNGSNVKNLLKCGYSLCSKDLFVQRCPSRLLYNCTTERNYCTPWSLRPDQKHMFSTTAIGVTKWNLQSSLVPVDRRYLFTTSPQNGQTALKPKSSERKSDKKLPKETENITTADNVDKSAKKHTEAENAVDNAEALPQEEEKLTLTARFKKMYKEYWYVLLPVHVVTSTVWLGGFYYLSTSGVDIPALLESMHFSEAAITKLRDSSMGHAAIAYLCYKIATPIRYTVTLGGTTLSIKYLSQWGYIRPVPTRQQIKRMYDDQKAKFKNP